MADLMGALATDARILNRILQETGGGIKRTGWMNLVIIITMASILTIFGTLSSFFIEAQLFVGNIGSGLKISVYAKDSADIDSLKRNLKAFTSVKKVDFIPKDKAWQDLQKNYDVPDITNPLPDTFHVQVKNQEQIEDTAEKIKKLSDVEEVNFAKHILRKLKTISKYTFGTGLAISIFFGVLTLFVISNTIHLLIQARSREIEILRMMGVGNWYIRLPFLFQGAFYGLMGAFIAYIPLNVAQFYINQLFETFQFSTNSFSLNIVFGVLILMGVLVGAGGATMSVHRYLKT